MPSDLCGVVKGLDPMCYGAVVRQLTVPARGPYQSLLPFGKIVEGKALHAAVSTSARGSSFRR